MGIPRPGVAGLSSQTTDCRTRLGDALSFERIIDGELTTPTLGLKTFEREDAAKKVDLAEVSACVVTEEDGGNVTIIESTPTYC